MGLQTIATYNSGLFLTVIFQIVGLMNKRSNIMSDIWSKYFIDPTIKENWQKIVSVFEPHILQSVLPTGVAPSTSVQQSDSSFGPYTISKFPSDYASLYDMSNSLGLLIDPDDMVYEYNESTNPQKNSESAMKWEMLLSSYLVLKIMEDTLFQIIETIKPLYRNLGVGPFLSPSQLWFFADEFMHGSLLVDDDTYGKRLAYVPWKTIEQFKTDDIENLGIVDIILAYHPTELWYINIPTITITGPAEETFAVTTSTKTVTLSGGLSFGFLYSFESDAPITPGGNDATCTATQDKIYANTIHVTVAQSNIPIMVPNPDPPPDEIQSGTIYGANSGTLTCTYHVLTVS